MDDANALKSSDCLSDVESAVLRQVVKKSVGMKQRLSSQCIGCPTASESRDKEQHKTFARYLRFTGHALLAKVVENGGGNRQPHLLLDFIGFYFLEKYFGRPTTHRKVIPLYECSFLCLL